MKIFQENVRFVLDMCICGFNIFTYPQTRIFTSVYMWICDLTAKPRSASISNTFAAEIFGCMEAFLHTWSNMTEPLMVKQNWAIHHNLEQVTANTYHDWCFRWLATGACKKYNCGWGPYHRDFPFAWMNDHQTVWRNKDKRIRGAANRQRVAVFEPYYMYERSVAALQSWTQIFNIKVMRESWHGAGTTRIEIWSIPDDELNQDQRILIRNTFRWNGAVQPAGPYFDSEGFVRLHPDRRSKFSDALLEKQKDSFYLKHGRFPLPGDMPDVKDPLAEGYLQPQESQEISESPGSIFENAEPQNSIASSGIFSPSVPEPNPFLQAAEKLETQKDESPGDEVA